MRNRNNTGQQMIDLKVVSLIPNASNIRESVSPELQELADSIREHGILQPLVVMQAPPRPGSPLEYTILAGHRRARAALLAGLATVPCVLRTVQDKSEETILMLIENTQRKDLNPIEQALALSALYLQGKQQKELAQMLGRSQAWISNRLALLELSEVSQRRLVNGDMTIAQAEKLIRDKRNDVDGKRQKHERSWAPAYLTHTHPLGKMVKKMCDERGHNSRMRVGKVGCGQCWEWAIQQDAIKVYEIEKRMAVDTGSESNAPSSGDPVST